MSIENEAPAEETPVESAPTDEKTTETPPKDPGAPKTYKLKNGKTEREVSEEELIELGRKGLSSDQRWQEAARMKKDVENALERFEEDPDKFLGVMRKLKGKGYESKVEMAKDILKAELARRTLTPEQIEKQKIDAELAQARAERDAMHAEAREVRVSAIEKQVESQWSQEIMAALDKHAFPKNKLAVARVAQTAQRVFDAGLDPDWDACVRETKAQMQRELTDFIESSGDDRLLGLLGEKLPKRVARLLAEGIGQSREPGRRGAPAQSTDSKASGNTKAVDLDSWAKKLEEFGK